MYEVRLGLSGRPKLVYSYLLIFLRRIKIATSWCCRYRQKLLLRLWTFLRTDVIPSIPRTTTTYSDNLDSHNKTAESAQTTWRVTWKSRVEIGHWDVDASTTINASQRFRYSNGRLIPLYCSTSKLTCFWAIFHRLSFFKQTPIWVGRSSKNMYVDQNQNHEPT